MDNSNQDLLSAALDDAGLGEFLVSHTLMQSLPLFITCDFELMLRFSELTDSLETSDPLPMMTTETTFNHPSQQKHLRFHSKQIQLNMFHNNNHSSIPNSKPFGLLFR
jgi:hypothetical protein